MKKITWDLKEQPELKCCGHCKHVVTNTSGYNRLCNNPVVVRVHPNEYLRCVGALEICSLFECENKEVMK